MKRISSLVEITNISIFSEGFSPSPRRKSAKSICRECYFCKRCDIRLDQIAKNGQKEHKSVKYICTECKDAEKFTLAHLIQMTNVDMITLKSYACLKDVPFPRDPDSDGSNVTLGFYEGKKCCICVAPIRKHEEIEEHNKNRHSQDNLVKCSRGCGRYELVDSLNNHRGEIVCLNCSTKSPQNNAHPEPGQHQVFICPADLCTFSCQMDNLSHFCQHLRLKHLWNLTENDVQCFFCRATFTKNAKSTVEISDFIKYICSTCQKGERFTIEDLSVLVNTACEQLLKYPAIEQPRCADSKALLGFLEQYCNLCFRPIKKAMAGEKVHGNDSPNALPCIKCFSCGQFFNEKPHRCVKYKCFECTEMVVKTDTQHKHKNIFCPIVDCHERFIVKDDMNDVCKHILTGHTLVHQRNRQSLPSVFQR